jgi:hypothetical protein
MMDCAISRRCAVTYGFPIAENPTPHALRSNVDSDCRVTIRNFLQAPFERRSL